ncbi:hypothetical protein PRZ48_002705 [Zasmidium cellare]|uniref:Uncharacterized protein n=1 Tax=Zasmidium cellare TaxID=395010 RepID=A0ABR0EV75_ZASCE|nr:hypothetical protein PRZ48_002705 [Zasmidium cellare]
MSRTTFPPDVFFWDSLKVALHMKKAADDMVCKGLWGQQQALARYSNVFRTVREWGFQRFIDNTVNPHTLRVVGAGKIPLYLILNLLTDVLSNAAELHMKLYGVQGERLETLYDLHLQMMESVFFLQNNSYGTPPQQYSLHPSHLLAACEDLMHGQQYPLQRVKALFEHCLQYTNPQDKDSQQRLTHDIAELDRILQSPELLKKSDQHDPEVWQSLSCFHFPPRVFHSKIFEEYGHLFEEPNAYPTAPAPATSNDNIPPPTFPSTLAALLEVIAAADPVADPVLDELSDPDLDAEEEAVPVNIVTSPLDVAVALAEAGALEAEDPVEADPFQSLANAPSNGFSKNLPPPPLS